MASLLPDRRGVVLSLAMAAGVAALLLAMGRVPICTCGHVSLWTGQVNGPVESFSHVSPGGTEKVCNRRFNDTLEAMEFVRVLGAREHNLTGVDVDGTPVDAVGVCRKRCWEKDWVVDLDVKAFFDTVSWNLALKAVASLTS